MARDPKLHALRRTYELEEQKVLDEKRRLDLILEQRALAFSTVENHYNTLSRRLHKLMNESRIRAHCSGAITELSAADAYIRRLTVEMTSVQAEVKSTKADLDRALHRVNLVQDEITAIRIEIKKVDKVIENRTNEARVTDVAREEAYQDELNYYRRKR